MGHFQADCTYPPVCLLCGVEGHFSAACTSKGRQPSLRVLGQAVAGESFFSLDFEEDDDEEELVSNGAIISFGAVSLSARELDRELHHLVEAEWDWQVQTLLGHSFAVTFPSRETLRMSTRSGKLYLPLSGTVADIRLADADPAPAEQLQEVWVRLSGVPRRMKRANRLLAGMGMLGWPIAIDEDSLKRPMPVRMLLACRNPTKLKGTVQLFHKKWGYNIGVAVEAPAGPSGGSSPRHPTSREMTTTMRMWTTSARRRASGTILASRMPPGRPMRRRWPRRLPRLLPLRRLLTLSAGALLLARTPPGRGVSRARRPGCPPWTSTGPTFPGRGPGRFPWPPWRGAPPLSSWRLMCRRTLLR
jgi:hypothetical protein